MTDRRRSSLWIVGRDGSDLRPLGIEDAGGPRWSPDGGRLAYVAEADGKPQVHVRFMDTGETARLTRLTEAPGGLAWSPDGRWIAFAMRVPATPEPFVKPPEKPAGASWAEPPRVVEKIVYREDGSVNETYSGYYEHGARTRDWVPD